MAWWYVCAYQRPGRRHPFTLGRVWVWWRRLLRRRESGVVEWDTGKEVTLRKMRRRAEADAATVDPELLAKEAAEDRYLRVVRALIPGRHWRRSRDLADQYPNWYTLLWQAYPHLPRSTIIETVSLALSYDGFWVVLHHPSFPRLEGDGLYGTQLPELEPPGDVAALYAGQFHNRRES